MPTWPSSRQMRSHANIHTFASSYAYKLKSNRLSDQSPLSSSLCSLYKLHQVPTTQCYASPALQCVHFVQRCRSFPEHSTQRPATYRQVSGASELPSLPQRLVTTSTASFSIHQRNDYSQDLDYTMLVHRLKQEEKEKRRLGGVFCT